MRILSVFLLFLPAHASPVGSDDFDSAPSDVSAGWVRGYGTIVAESTYTPGTAGWLERYDDPSGSGYAMTSYGDAVGVDFSAPVDSFRVTVNGCQDGCGCTGGYADPRSGWVPGSDGVVLEVRDTSGAAFDYAVIPWTVDLAASSYDEEGTIYVDYLSATDDIGGFRIHWGAACYLLCSSTTSSSGAPSRR
jgi:hypothetical protein